MFPEQETHRTKVNDDVLPCKCLSRSVEVIGYQVHL